MNGQELKYALKKASVWGTAVAAGALNGFLGRPSGIKRKDNDVDVDDSLGSSYSLDGSTGDIVVDGDQPQYLRYDGCDEWLAGAMGTAGVPATHAAGTLSKDYTYAWADSLDGIFFTFAKNMGGVYVREVPSLKISGFTLSGQAGAKPLMLTPKTIGSHMIEDGTNTTTTWANVTIRETANRVRLRQGVFRLNVQSAGALAGGDTIKPVSFELSVMRKLAGYQGANTYGTANVMGFVDEPTNDGRPEIRLKLTFPRHTAKTYITALGADTRYKMDITFTGPIIESAIPRLFKIELPNLQLLNVDPTDADGNIDEPLEFICHGCAAAPTGMTSLTAPLRISGTNKLATNPLA